MKMKRFCCAATLLVAMLSNSVSAQKHSEGYRPESLYEEGLVMFRNGEYGAARVTFGQYLAEVGDGQSQHRADACYYEAVSSLYLGSGDGVDKVLSFIEDHPGSLWAGHANYLYANYLFGSKKYKDALAIYEKTNVSSLTQEEAYRLQFNMAYCYFQMDDYEKALPLFRGVMLNEGACRDAARYYYAHIQYVKGHDEEALTNFERLQSNPVYAKIVPSYVMQISNRRGDYEKVVREGPEAIRKVENKRKTEMALIVADAYFRQHDYDKALEFYDVYSRHLSGRGFSREACYQMGVSRMMTEDYKGAISSLQRVAGSGDLLGQYASYYLALSYAKTGELKYARNAYYTAYSAGFDSEISEEALFDYARLSLIPGADPFNEAVGLLDSYVAENPRSARRSEAEEMSVYLLLAAKKNDDALDRLESMRNKSPELQGVYNEMLYSTGVDSYQNGRYDRALACFSKVLNGKQTSVNKPQACFWMGESAYALGDYASAVRYLKQFKNMPDVSGMSEFAQADYDLGYIYYQKPDYESAIAHFRNFIQSCDDRQKDLKSDAYIRLGDCFFMDRNYTQAINYYDLATRVGKRNSDYSLYQQGLCYGAKGDVNKKIEMLNQLIQTYPSTGYYDQALFEIGNTYLVHGDKRSALASFNKLVKERPRSSYTRQALMKVGMVYYNNNQYDLALANLKNLAENYPNTDESREALTIIRSIMMEQNKLDDYFSYANALGGQVRVSEQDSLSFATAENFYLDGRYEQAARALRYYFDNFKKGAYLLKAHRYAWECAEKVGTEEEMVSHLDFVLAQPDNDYTDDALLKKARIEYEHQRYDKAGDCYGRLACVTEAPLRRLEALEGGMKSNFFLGNYDKAIEVGLDLSRSKDLTKEQVNQINHILGKSYFEKGNYHAAIESLDKSVKADKSVYGAESAYYSALSSVKLKKYADAENKVFDLADHFSSYDYWVAKSFILLADVYVAQENYFQAKETLRSVVDNYDGEDLRTEARVKLNEVEKKSGFGNHE